MKKVITLSALAMMVVAGVFHWGCSKKNPTQPDPTTQAVTPPATYDPATDSLHVPNSTIITEGIEYQNTAFIPDTGLALIIASDSSLYFYTPLQGNLSAVTQTTAKEALMKIVLSYYAKKTPKIDTTNGVGLRVRHIASDTLGIQNTYYRWAAYKRVSPQTQTSGTRLLKPASLYNISLFNLIVGNWSGIVTFAEPEDTIRYYRGANPDTFHFVSSAAKLALFPANWPILYMREDFLPQFRQSLQADATLVARVNVVETLDVIFSIVKLVASTSGAETLAEKCTNTVISAITSQMQTTLQTLATNATTNQQFAEQSNTLLKTSLNILIDVLSQQEKYPGENPGIKNEKGLLVIVLWVLKTIFTIIPVGTNFVVGSYQSATGDIYSQWYDMAGPPAAPTLSSPANGATGVATNPTLTWNASSGATSYTLQVSTSSTFSSFIYNQSGLTNTSQAIIGLGNSTVYYWRVSATNTYGASGWSSVWSFTTMAGGLPNIEWISIPAGNFKMGSLPGDPYAFTDEQPQHLVYLNAYQISRYEITNSQYQIFINSGGYSDSTYWTSLGWGWRKYYNITEPLFWSSGQYNSGPSYPNHPVVGVSWYEAYAFSKWAGGNLPTEAQWEKAARGTDSSNYWPWGNSFDPSKVNGLWNTPPDTFNNSSPVGYFNSGQSPYLLFDMACNVSEWVNDWYQSNYYSVSPTSNPTGPSTGSYRVVRGCAFRDYGDEVVGVCADRYFRQQHEREDFIGFRVAK